MGWDSDAVLAVRNLYDSARDGNRTRLINRIAGEAVLATEQANAAVEGYEGLAPSSETPWATLKGFERTPLLEAWAPILAFCSYAFSAGVGDWMGIHPEAVVVFPPLRALVPPMSQTVAPPFAASRTIWQLLLVFDVG